MGFLSLHKVESVVDPHSGVAVESQWPTGLPGVCGQRRILLKAEPLVWKDHGFFSPDNFSTLAQKLQFTACGAALSSGQANLKQPLNKQMVVLPFGWYITIYLT